MAVSDWSPLAGVIIGAGCTGGVQAWAEARRDRRELRAAARLVFEELTTNGGTVKIIAEMGKWPAKEHHHLVVHSDAWDAHKGALARMRDFEPWGDISIAYLDLWHVAHFTEQRPEQPLGLDLSHAVQSIENAERALQDYA